MIGMRVMKNPILLAAGGFGLGLAILSAVPATGQALKGHNAKADVDVDAQRIEVQDRADRAVFSGNVRVRQAGLTLNAERLTLAYSRSGGNPQIERIDASGGVQVKSATESARGDFAIYDLNRRLITMIGGVELIQQGNRVRGGRLLIDLNSGRAVVDGSGATSPTTGPLPDGVVRPSTGGRVTGHFTVSKKEQ